MIFPTSPKWLQLVLTGPSWPLISPQPAPNWPQLSVRAPFARAHPREPLRVSPRGVPTSPQTAPIWPQLAPTDPTWPHLAPNWPQLAPTSPQTVPNWLQLAPTGPTWHHLAPAKRCQVGPAKINLFFWWASK